MNMSIILTKPSTCVNRQVFSADYSSGSRFHPLYVKDCFNYNINQGSSRHCQRLRTLTVRSNQQVPPPVPPPVPSNSFPGLPGRKGWIAGAVLAFLLPFLSNKWGPLLLFKKQVDEKLQTVEDVAETLENVADRVEHIAEDVAKDLPEGPLKRAAMFVEYVAEKVETTAHLTDEAIDKGEAAMNAQAIKKFVEENQKLAAECESLVSRCSNLEKECSLYDHDREALMEFGNEADERAKDAEIKVCQLEEKLNDLNEEVKYYKTAMLSGGSSDNGTLTEQKLLNTVVANFVTPDEAAQSALVFLKANSEIEAYSELLKMCNRLRPETKNILSLIAQVRALQKDKEHLRINLHRAEEEVGVLAEENSVLDKENKRLVKLYSSEKRHASSGGRHDSSARTKKNNKRKTSPVMCSPVTPVDRKIDTTDLDALRCPLSPLKENSPGTIKQQKNDSKQLF